MKRLIVILVAVLALVGMWMLIKKDETAEPETHTTVLQHIDPVDTTEEPKPTSTSTTATSTTRRNTTARNAQQTSNHDTDAAQNAASQNQANANANASASQNAATVTDATTTATNSESTQATDASATTQTTEPTQQTTQTSQTDQTTQTTENPGFGQPGNVDFDDTDEQTDQDIGTTTEAGTPEDGDWIPDFSGSDAEGDFFGGEPNHDADTGETPEP